MAAVVTETWLADGPHLEDDKQDLLLGAVLGILCKNRKRNQSGVAHGGVAIVYKEDSIVFKEKSFPNPDQFEVLVAAGTMQGHARKMSGRLLYASQLYH